MVSGDNGLVAAVANPIWGNSAHQLENLVFLHLRRICTQIFYYRSKDDYEVDFVVLNNKHKIMLVQVCMTLVDPKVLQREMRGLEAGMQECKAKEAYIVTLDEKRDIKLESGKGIVHVLPAWEFCLKFGN